MKRLQLETMTVQYERIAPKRRQVRVILRMHGPVLQVSAPKYVSTSVIEDVIRRNQTWIQKQVAQGREIVCRPLQIGDGISYRGQILSLTYASLPQSSSRNVLFDLDSKQVLIDRHVEEQDIHTAVYASLRAEAREELTRLIRNTANQYGLAPRRICIKEQKRRFGSCSSQGSINLNWRLIQAPDVIATYVVIHELAHLLEMNHSSRFWSVVRNMMPDYDIHRTWLREHGLSLYELEESQMTFRIS